MHETRSHILITALATAALLLAACGGGDDEAAPGDGSPSTTTTGATAATERNATTTTGATATTERNAATTTAADSSGPSLICENPPPTEVGLGTPLDSDLDTQQCFWVEVPDGTTSVTVAVGGLDTEVRLGVYYGYVWNVQFPGVAAYWTADRQSEATEVTIDDPQAGPYFFYLSKGRNAVSDFTVEVTTEPATAAAPGGGSIAGTDVCGGPATVLSSGDTVEGEILARGSGGSDAANDHHAYYCVEVADAGGTLTIDLTDAEGFFDIQVIPPDHGGKFFHQTERVQPDKSLTIEDVRSGAYYIDIGPALSSAAGTFEITATLG